MNDKILSVLKVVFFAFCMFLIIYGQRTVGKLYLLMQLVGLAGLLFLLWNYNRKFV
ncbi:hypothetical protein KQI49_01040 [Virgibacillus sp. MSJ-26]|uniref:DUF6903 family protein n=1 Tax=Virgibacillus sp. MSJ-26 TaxID=2841522 RepID=UPI001C1169BA|nr:hypothetical protein [Virgibacillus sp. MSJ-26]MBU5465411.1 hypothetical protein [Virgibacillus sp. MSJ-26]